jgi:bacterioferritin (cytochrome b1)
MKTEIEVELEPREMVINRTGIMTNPELSAQLIEGAKKTVPSSKGDGSEISEALSAYLEEATAIGSEPEPIKLPETAHEQDLPGEFEKSSIFLDKLGERLAFERQGTRLYETVIRKCELLAEDDGGPSPEDLRHIYEEEKEHFEMLQRVISNLGGDATVQTVSADVAGVLSHGILQIVSDPRTTLAQTLQAVLSAELTDNDGWETLANLASALGYTELNKPFVAAFQEEQEHLKNVRNWLSAMTLNEIAASGATLEDFPEDASKKGAKSKPRKSRSSRRSTGSGKKRKT